MEEMKSTILTSIKDDLKKNWMKIILYIAVVIMLYFAYGEYQDWKEWRGSQNKIVQTSPQPIFINGAGQQMTNPPPVYVSVTPTVKETTTARIEEKQNPKTDPDVNVVDMNKYKLRYNGKDYILEPNFKEDYKFQNGTMVIERNAEMTVGIEVPQPVWGVGIGYSVKGDPAVQADARLGKTPFNVWGYASPSDQAVGIKFVQYNTKPEKKPETKTVVEEKKDETRSTEGTSKTPEAQGRPISK
jgi:hypothetical protein